MPGETPVTTPVPEPTVAIVVVLLIQLPPAVASLNVVVAPTQSIAVPVMLVGGIYKYKPSAFEVSLNPELVQYTIQR